ncbi:MAG: hypothetical protein AAGF47_12310 [Planctomycetota bacterium]
MQVQTQPHPEHLVQRVDASGFRPDRVQRPRFDQFLEAVAQRERLADRLADRVDFSADARRAAGIDHPKTDSKTDIEHNSKHGFRPECPKPDPAADRSWDPAPPAALPPAELSSSPGVRPEAVERYEVLNRAATGRLIDMLM